MGNGLFRIPPGRVAQEEEGVDISLVAGENIRDIHDGSIREGDCFDFRKFLGQEMDDFIHDFTGNYDTDSHETLLLGQNKGLLRTFAFPYDKRKWEESK